MTREQREVWRRLETQARLTPQAPMKIALGGSKILPAPQPSTDRSCSATTRFQISKAVLYLRPTEAISIGSPENTAQIWEALNAALDKTLYTRLMPRRPSPHVPAARRWAHSRDELRIPPAPLLAGLLLFFQRNTFFPPVFTLEERSSKRALGVLQSCETGVIFAHTHPSPHQG